MTQIPTSSLAATNPFDRATEARNNITKTLLAQNPGMKLIDQRVENSDARLSIYGKLALAVDDFRTVASKFAEGKTDKSATTGTTLEAGIRDLVKAYNGMNGKVDGLKTGDIQTDGLLGKVQGQLSGLLDGADGRALAGFGITQGKNGLVLDEDKFKKALAANPDGAATLFSGKDGLAGRMADMVSKQVGDGGIVAREAETVTRQRDSLVAQKERAVNIVSSQAAMLAQQYQLIGSGGDPALGGLGRPMSLFDFMA